MKVEDNQILIKKGISLGNENNHSDKLEIPSWDAPLLESFK